MTTSAINSVLYSSTLSLMDSPANTKSFDLMMEALNEPDLPHAQTDWVPWVLYNILENLMSFMEHVEKLTYGAGEGLKDWHEDSYGDPCPPIANHRYFQTTSTPNIELTKTKSQTKPDWKRQCKVLFW